MKGNAGKKKGFVNMSCVLLVIVVVFLLAFPWIYAMSRKQVSTTNGSGGDVLPIKIGDLTAQIAKKFGAAENVRIQARFLFINFP